jgi:diguanylate cyclase (GGDEF)-like protein
MIDLTNASSALRALVDLSGDGACLVDPDEWHVVYANPSLLRRVGLAHDTLGDSSILAWLPDLTSPEAREQLERLAGGELEAADFVSRLACPGGGESVSVRARRVAGKQGPMLAIVVMAAGAGVRRPGTDPLTGLADRAFLLDRLTTILRGGRSGDDDCAVLFVDVDGFKQVNDLYGHLVGDRVLREVARRLAGSVRDGDQVARFGGDEFVVLLQRIRDRKAIEPVVRRIEAAFRQPIPLPQGEVILTVSMGAAQAHVDGESAEALIDAADQAMYAAKRATA